MTIMITKVAAMANSAPEHAVETKSTHGGVVPDGLRKVFDHDDNSRKDVACDGLDDSDNSSGIIKKQQKHKKDDGDETVPGAISVSDYSHSTAQSDLSDAEVGPSPSDHHSKNSSCTNFKQACIIPEIIGEDGSGSFTRKFSSELFSTLISEDNLTTHTASAAAGEEEKRIEDGGQADGKETLLTSTTPPLREEDEDDAQGNQEASEEVAQAVSEMEHAYCADDGNNFREGEEPVESSDRPSSSDPSDDSRVRFGDIEICEHGMILGDHPGKFLVLG